MSFDRAIFPLAVGQTATDDDVRRAIDAINMIYAQLNECNRALIALAGAIAQQPHVDRQTLHNDFVDLAGTFHISTGHKPGDLSPQAATIASFILQPFQKSGG